MFVSLTDARSRNLDCSNVLFYAFGASYPDGSCVDGYLWDDDSVENGHYTCGGDIPCPLCRPDEYDEYNEDNNEGQGKNQSEVVLGVADLSLKPRVDEPRHFGRL